MRARRQGFTIVELLVVVAIIIFITALSIPAFNSFFRNQGIAKAARMVQTAVMQTRTRAVGVGRQQMIQFKNDYNRKSGNTVIVVMDPEEDQDGDGNPWTSTSDSGDWESGTPGDGFAGFTVATVKVPSGFTWMPGKSSTGDFTGLPVVICMPDGTLRLFEEGENGGTPKPLDKSFTPPVTTDEFNDDTKAYHELAVQRGAGGDRYLLHFLKSSGRVKIKAEPVAP